MKAGDVTETLNLALQASCLDQVHVADRPSGGGVDVDEGGDDQTRADAQRGENLGEERSKGKLRLPRIYTRSASLSERWSLVFWRTPIEEKCSAGIVLDAVE